MKLLTKASYCPDVTLREQENLQVAYQAACESMVLLKNDGTLPLKTKRIALYGPGASMTVKGGTGSGEVNERHSVTLLEGLENRGFQILTKDWIENFEKAYADAQRAYKEEKRKRVNILKPNSIMQMLFDNFRAPVGLPITEKADTDACIYVLSRQAGEGGDRKLEPGDYLLTGDEIEAIRFCAEHYPHFVLVINCGSFVDLSCLDGIPGINAILYICQLGTEGGHAFADLISGVVTPSGRLADTWAKKYEDLPFAMDYSHLNGNVDQENYREGIYVGYRYFDTFDVEPAYPFGYGLSYTSFSIYSAGVTVDGTAVTVKAHITNTGRTYSGMEVAQLYLSSPQGSIPKEHQALAAFGKTRTLAPGESQLLDLTFELAHMASYRESDSCYVLEPGQYILWLGRHSRINLPVGILTLDKEVIVSRHQPVCPPVTPLKELKAPERTPEEFYPGLPRIPLDPNAFRTVVHSYETPPVCGDAEVQKILSQLSLREMVDVVVGIGMFGGETRFTLPGAVGNTTSKFWDRGLANVTLCDGPAGLRIQKKSTVSPKGKVKPVEMAMSIFESFPDFVKKAITGNPEKEPVVYQYATAFPVAAALAQTWNTDLLYQVGHAIYREMKEYGCTYWLAPAVNIHRNPLCGRNFEYFSEDPRLAGRMAAAITRGVQQEDGYYVTVKHFACNNMEENRNKVSSNLSERALREIYLRPFQMAVQEGGAKAIMTSYNKINGVYAPNSYDLCTRVLRNEWGFDGVVMTDWFSTNPGFAGTAACISAGNDLIMPGGASFKAEILTALKTGKIREEDLRRCCANVVRSILHSAIQKEYIG